MREDLAISVKNLNKTFYSKELAKTGLGHNLVNLFSNKNRKKIVALKNVSFEVKKGETLGIIGRNGSGKSTLIYLIMGALLGDKGSEVTTQGKIMRLALGMGVDKNLTARENIYVNGSVLGLSFKKIGQIFDQVIEFAGLEEFVDIPVKNFSSGMKARLNFSVAMHANADIFLLDEFFGGVGDEDFKEKSDAAFKQKILEGRTIVIVSHSMKIIEKYCEKAIWIDKGDFKLSGSTPEVIKAYRNSYKKNNKNV